jgi:hypothetical protein
MIVVQKKITDRSGLLNIIPLECLLFPRIPARPFVCYRATVTDKLKSTKKTKKKR